MNEFWGRLSTAFSNLSSRERALVAGAGCLALASVLYFGVVVPVLAIGSRASASLEAAESEYEVVKRLRAEHDAVRQRLAGVEERIQAGTRGSLRTTLESLAQKSQVTVESMEPQVAPSNDRYRETKVEVKLEGATLPQMIHYLHEIESASELLIVKTLRIRTRADKPELLDAVFTVSSFERI